MLRWWFAVPDEFSTLTIYGTSREALTGIDPSYGIPTLEQVAAYLAANRERFIAAAVGTPPTTPGTSPLGSGPTTPIWAENTAWLYGKWRKQRDKDRALFEFFRPGAELAAQSEFIWGPMKAVSKGQDPYKAVAQEAVEDKAGHVVLGDDWIFFDPLV